MKEFFQYLYEGEFQMAFALLSSVLVRLAFAFLILWIGRKLVRRVLNIIGRGLGRQEERGMDEGLSKFLHSLCKVALHVLLFVILFEILGLPIASVATLIGSAGLAIGLAMQGTLSNFAGGVLILLTKPFSVDDYIVVSGLEGTVQEIGICYTRLLTPDNRTVILPNGSLANSNLINVSEQPERRVDLVVPIAYEDDIRAVRKMLLGLLEERTEILPDKPCEIYVKELADSSVNLVMRVWVKKQDYWPVYFGLIESVKYAMQENGFTIPYRQLDIHMDK